MSTELFSTLPYKVLRWKTFFEQKQQELEGKASGEVINFYGMEKAWLLERRRTTGSFCCG